MARNHKERLLQLVRDAGLVRPRDLQSADIPRAYLAQLVEDVDDFIVDKPVAPVDVLVSQTGDVAMGTAKQPAKLVKVPALRVDFTPDDALVLSAL